MRWDAADSLEIQNSTMQSVTLGLYVVFNTMNDLLVIFLTWCVYGGLFSLKHGKLLPSKRSDSHAWAGYDFSNNPK